MAREEVTMIDLPEALDALERRGPQARPYACRVESACNYETADVIATYGLEMGSVSEAIRDLLARGAASLKAERAAARQ